jgi:phasin family protein
MFSVPEQFTNATKASFDAQIAAITAFTQKAFAHVEKVVELNMTVAKESFAESTAAAHELMTAKGAQEFLALTTAKAKPSAEKVMAYGRELASIASAAQTELARDAEVQLAETRRKVASLVDDIAKNAPAGTESVVAMVKTAMGNANAGFDQFSKTAKQAADTIEANVTSTVSKFSEVAQKTTRAKK